LLHFVQNHQRLTRQLTARIQVTPVRRVFARLQRLLATELAARGIQMTADVDPETLELAVDIDLLDQALINLVRNAVDALRDMQDGVVALSARRDPDGHIAIAVADNGPGIPPAEREKVFVPFYTTKRQGSGIGLTIVRQIATAHGARVDISAVPAGGALVTLRF
jgi:signal transduction histidine kinase